MIYLPCLPFPYLRWHFYSLWGLLKFFGLIKLSISARFGSAQHLSRWSEIKAQIEESDGYIMKTEELKYGATVAWRNAPRCPGRIQWKKLQVQFTVLNLLIKDKSLDLHCGRIV